MGAMGAPLVGLTAERVFGFTGSLGASTSGGEGVGGAQRCLAGRKAAAAAWLRASAALRWLADRLWKRAVALHCWCMRHSGAALGEARTCRGGCHRPCLPPSAPHTPYRHADGANVRALSNALLVCMVVPWTLCLSFFTCLHWTYREDRRKLLRGGGDGARARCCCLLAACCCCCCCCCCPACRRRCAVARWPTALLPFNLQPSTHPTHGVQSARWRRGR